MKTWKPTAAAVLSIVSGAFIFLYRSGAFTRAVRMHGLVSSQIPSSIGIIIGLIAVVGGTLAIRRRVWGLALAGAICALFPPHPWGDLTWTPVLGIFAIVFVVLSKNEFTDSVKGGSGVEVDAPHGGS
jgi:hypothetical protein